MFKFISILLMDQKMVYTKIVPLFFLSLTQFNLLANNKILSIVCIKNITTLPEEQPNVLSSESLYNTLKNTNASELANKVVNPDKIKEYLNEYFDEKIYRIEYGSDLNSRLNLRKSYNNYLNVVSELSKHTTSPKSKQKIEALKKLRIFSYQTLTRGKLNLSEDTNNIPFGIQEYPEIIAQLVNMKPFIYGETLELLQFAGGHGNFYEKLPTAIGSLQLTEFLSLCLTINNKVKDKICGQGNNFINSLKKNCSLINATVDNAWYKQNFTYSVDSSSKEVRTNVSHKSLGGIPKKTFENIRNDLENFVCKTDEDLKLTAKTIYLNAAWSSAFLPMIEPILCNRGIIISVISAPNDNNSATDITDKFYSNENIQSRDVIKSFFEWYKISTMNIPNTNNGFFPYIFLKKINDNLLIHYYLDSELSDFVVGYEKRENAQKKDSFTRESFPGLQNFNKRYNENESNPIVERIYIWWCCWHAAITEDVIKEATNEALKVKSLLEFFKDNNMHLKLHRSFEEFERSALNLFEPVPYE